MPNIHHPKRGSHGYWPRKRAASQTPHIQSWVQGGDKPKLQAFYGYKAGMTHAFIIDYRPASTTAGREVKVPVTVVETPPMRVAAIRTYQRDAYGLHVTYESWADTLEPELAKCIPLPKKKQAAKDIPTDAEELRVIIYTQPKLVTGIPKKSPEITEIKIGGGSIQDQITYAKSILGKELTIYDVVSEGQMLDTIAVTKGKGFQGTIKRHHVKLLFHKNSKHRRLIGTAGSWHPSWVQATVPQAGQLGYAQRTEYNKRVLKIGDNGTEITPAGGFPKYGVVRNSYILLHGSIPGPTKRLIGLRDAIRYKAGVKVQKPEVTFISVSSKQGV
jgi:large subunit ribosomal protein L3